MCVFENRWRSSTVLLVAISRKAFMTVKAATSTNAQRPVGQQSVRRDTVSFGSRRLENRNGPSSNLRAGIAIEGARSEPERGVQNRERERARRRQRKSVVAIEFPRGVEGRGGLRTGVRSEPSSPFQAQNDQCSSVSASLQPAPQKQKGMLT